MATCLAPSERDVIAIACELEVYDVNGDKTHFPSLCVHFPLRDVFIGLGDEGHFFCGACEEYVRALAKVPTAALQVARTRIIVIGCGGWELIQVYHELTAFRGDIYTNPDLKVYHALGMDMESTQTTPSTERKCSYRTTSMFTNGLFSGVTAQIRSSRSRLIGGQGPPMQLGGDFVFGPGPECHLALKMQHIEDHVEVAHLIAAAEVVV